MSSKPEKPVVPGPIERPDPIGEAGAPPEEEADGTESADGAG